MRMRRSAIARTLEPAGRLEHVERLLREDLVRDVAPLHGLDVAPLRARSLPARPPPRATSRSGDGSTRAPGLRTLGACGRLDDPRAGDACRRASGRACRAGNRPYALLWRAAEGSPPT